MLTTHVTFSIGWIGTVAAFLALAISGLTGNEQMVTACYIAMELVAWFTIVPLCFASLCTGIVQAVGTRWGLFRHYWVVVKLFLTLIATALLMLHMKPISYVADVASRSALDSNELHDLRIQLIADAGAAIFVLLAITTVSVYKPWGKIEFGLSLLRFQPTTRKPLGTYLLIGFIAVVLLFMILHLTVGFQH